ncbi:methyltransferase domain-containing protein (plasmid) [Azospirillum sp. 412522]|nr:methyltransferase domain-containing protein [Azospirillum sp. 412522]MBY6266484.1 methyltransferase domain-containing protein [Azospirillum sp. 412522]
MTHRSLTKTRETCRLCGSGRLDLAIPLKPLPIVSPNVGDAGGVDLTAPADVYRCADCSFLQLNTMVDPEFQYRNFRYVTGISVGLREHFAALLDQLADAGELAPHHLVFDIGSNDGTVLALARAHGARILGIDPAEQTAHAASAAGIPTVADFFTAPVADRLSAEHGRAHLIICNNTLANIDGLDDVFAGIGAMLDPGGLVVIETQYAADMIAKTLLDVIYHEHISYFAVAPMLNFVTRHGLEVFDAERIAPKGGSIRFLLQVRGGPRPISPRVAELLAEENAAGGIGDPAVLTAFNARIAQLGHTVRERLAQSRAKTGRGLVYGSSVGCAALIHYFELAPLIDAVFDDTPLQDTMRSPVGPLPVLPGSRLIDEAATDIAVLAWRYADLIAASQAAYRAKGGRFYRVLPDPTFVVP